MRIAEVTTAREARDFLKLPVDLYRNEPRWIRPLDKDIEAVFDPSKNHAFRHGECTRWVLYNDAGKPIGRVAAFVNRRTVHKGNDQPTGGMGFFECIDDQPRSEEHTSELQSRENRVCRLLLEKTK